MSDDDTDTISKLAKEIEYLEKKRDELAVIYKMRAKTLDQALHTMGKDLDGTDFNALAQNV